MQKYGNIIPEQKKFLLEIEKYTNAEVPDYHNVDSDSFGMVVKNKEIICLALYNLKIDQLPESIGVLTSLRKLFLGRNKLTCLPKSIANLTNLEVLDLSNNNIEMLPDEIGTLESLKILNLKDNSLNNIPNSINNLSKIEDINIWGNNLKNILEFPDKLLALKYKLKPEQVRALIGIENEIQKKIPSKDKFSDFDICYLKSNDKIIGLILSNCNLIKLPSSIKLLKDLKMLFLGNNKLLKLPEFITELENLEYLELHDNKIKNLPENFHKLKNLKGLSLYGNNFNQIPSSIFSLKNLEILDLRNNNIKVISNSIKDLKYLEKIDFSRNPIEKISSYSLKKKYGLKVSDAKFLWNIENELNIIIKEVNDIKNKDLGYKSKKGEISDLALCNCNIKIFSNFFVRLKSLESLYLNENHITKIPDIIEFLQSLKILDMSNNKISNISDKIGELSKLKELYLNNNCIDEIPSSLGKLSSLEKLFLHKNNIEIISTELDGLKISLQEIKLDWLKIQKCSDSITLKCFELVFSDYKILSQLEDLLNFKIPKLKSSKIEKVGYIEENGYIKTIYLKELNLQKIPKYLKNLKNLKALYLTSNYISNLPDFIFNLKKIEKLDLSSNHLEKISEKIEDLTDLKWLDLSANNINAVPNQLLEKRGLKYLNLKENDIEEIPNVFSEENLLEEINLKGNSIKFLPDSLSKVKTLKNLHVDWDNLERILNSFLRFRFNLDEKQAIAIKDIKDSTKKDISSRDKIGHNTRGYKIDNANVIELCLYNCSLKKIPESIGNLEHLQKLYLNNNQLKTLPKTIIRLSELNYLNIKNNEFEKLPPELYYLNKLSTFKWRGNNWEKESLDVITNGIFYIQDYCKKILTIDLFLSHKVIENKLFHIENIAKFLKNQDQINQVYYCEEHLVGDIDSFMEKYVPKSDILIFFGSKNSIYDSKDCQKEINLAIKNKKLIIPIKGEDIEWSDFNEYNIERIRGVAWKGENNLSEFLKELYENVVKLKREYSDKIV